MNILATLKSRFAQALVSLVDPPGELLEMIRPSQDPKFGDYQANCAMPLGKQLGRPPRDVAAEIVARLHVEDLCHPPEIAGPGFINLRLRDEWLAEALAAARKDERIGVPPTETPRTYVVDYSAPNVAKPMHVGHIRSTVIGDALARTLRFVGHRVITDNHIGDWGTQFGMILFGYKHFLDPAAYRQNPVGELARLYRLVSQLVGYHEAKHELPRLRENLEATEGILRTAETREQEQDKAARKKAAKERKRLESRVAELREQSQELIKKIDAVESDPALAALAREHAEIQSSVLHETALLHRGDPENLKLWKEFLPPCLEDIQRIYDRMGVSFDHTLGESFYHDRLAAVVEELKQLEVATESEGAVCVFFDDQEVPMIVQKKDGAFLYATTDLATIEYRMETWRPAAILYVVDHRQSLHFQQLFAAVRRWGERAEGDPELAARRAGYREVDLRHVKFGTVLGEDGRPFKTRSGDTVGLESLLDEAVARAHKIVCENDDAKPEGPELSAQDRQQIAKKVGIAALKYADLAHHRESDYTFSYDKMLALNGNTATYMQYAYARVCSIFAKGGVDRESLASGDATITIAHPAERALALELFRLAEAIDLCVEDDRPNHLTEYLFALAERYTTFYTQCPVLKADTPEQRTSRLLLCDLTARALKTGLGLLGIEVVEKM